jgi:hypothetical protein
MPLPALIKSLEEVAEPFRSEYTETADGWTLQVENSDFTAKINEFRTNNIALKQQLEDAQKIADKFKGVDLTKYKNALKTQEALEEKQLLDAGEIDKVIEQRTATMRAAYEGQLQAITQDRDQLQGQSTQYKTQLDQIAVSTVIAEALTKVAQPKRGAMEDINLRAKNVWKVTENGILPMQGDKVLYSKNGSSPMTPEEWIIDLTQTSSYLFEPNQGGGSMGGGKSQQQAGKVVSKANFSSNLEDIASGKKVLMD